MLLVAPNIHTMPIVETDPQRRPTFDSALGRITLAPGGKLYGAREAAAYLGMNAERYKFEVKRGYIVGVKVGQAVLVTDGELDSWRIWQGLGPYSGEALPCAEAGPSGVLLTRRGVAALRGVAVETLRPRRSYGLTAEERAAQLARNLPQPQRVAQLELYRLEDVERLKRGEHA